MSLNTEGVSGEPSSLQLGSRIKSQRLGDKFLPFIVIFTSGSVLTSSVSFSKDIFGLSFALLMVSRHISSSGSQSVAMIFSLFFGTGFREDLFPTHISWMQRGFFVLEHLERRAFCLVLAFSILFSWTLSVVWRTCRKVLQVGSWLGHLFTSEHRIVRELLMTKHRICFSLEVSFFHFSLLCRVSILFVNLKLNLTGLVFFTGWPINIHTSSKKINNLKQYSVYFSRIAINFMNFTFDCRQ